MSEATSLAERRARGAAQFRTQAKWCRDIGSPIYATLLAATADDCEAGGPAWGVVDGHEDMPVGDVLPIRVAGSVHRLVLTGRAPELAPFYASAAAAPTPAARAMIDTCGLTPGQLGRIDPSAIQTPSTPRS